MNDELNKEVKVEENNEKVEEQQPIVIEEPVEETKPEPTIIIEEPKEEEPTPAAPVQQPVQTPAVPTNNNKGSNTLLMAIIVVLGIIAVVCVVMLVLTSSNGNKGNENNSGGSTSSVNEYENNEGGKETPKATPTPSATDEPKATPTPTPSATPTPTQEPTADNVAITYGGFTFNKISGYEYTLDSELLMVLANGTVAVEFGVEDSTFDEVLSDKDIVESQISTIFTVGEFKNSTYNGVKIMTFEVSAGTNNGFYFISESPSSNSVFCGIVLNENGTVNYSDLNVVANIKKNAQASSSSFSKTGDETSGYNRQFKFDKSVFK